MSDTIFALATAQGKAGLAVIRISGPDAFTIASKLSEQRIFKRAMKLAVLKDGSDQRLDEALVLSFVGPASFTGEDVVELHLLGSMAIVTIVLKTLASMGLRLADPGEFTRRALENGRLDLTQVEGLADLIDAETEAQRQQAERVFCGVIGNAAEKWRTLLVRAAALVEATIDFSDEDVPVDVTPEVRDLLAQVKFEISEQVAGASVAERVRNGFEVAIVGVPNVGKSTLLNRLAGREAALTSEFAGTTRDIVEVRMDVRGLPVTFLDTAGLRATLDTVEQMGVELAKTRAASADLRVFLVEEGAEKTDLWKKGDIVCRAKADLKDISDSGVSGLTGQGVDRLLAKIADILLQRTSRAGFVVRERHLMALSDSLEALDRAQDLLALGSNGYDILAEELRGVVRSLETLVGRIGVEDLLGEIFERFCLGK